MPVAWISYEWADNQYRDVDFVAQELQRVGLQVRLKQWDLGDRSQTSRRCVAALLCGHPLRGARAGDVVAHGRAEQRSNEMRQSFQLSRGAVV